MAYAAPTAFSGSHDTQAGSGALLTNVALFNKVHKITKTVQESEVVQVDENLEISDGDSLIQQQAIKGKRHRKRSCRSV